MAVLNDQQVFDRIAKLAEESGVKLFDIEVPKGPSGVLRVFIYGGEAKSSTAGLDDCAQLARLILDLEDVESLLPGEMTLEVSSPGVNRKLRTAEHFAGAVGERVKLAAKMDTGRRETLRGVVDSFDGHTLVMRPEPTLEPREIDLANIAEARVDFLFE